MLGSVGVVDGSHQSHAERAWMKAAQALEDASTVQQQLLQLARDGLSVSRLTPLDQLFSLLEQCVQTTCTFSHSLLEALIRTHTDACEIFITLSAGHMCTNM